MYNCLVEPSITYMAGLFFRPLPSQERMAHRITQSPVAGGHHAGAVDEPGYGKPIMQNFWIAYPKGPIMHPSTMHV